MPPQPSPSTFWSITLLVFGTGVLTAFQHGMNARFSRVAGHSFHGGMLNFAVGLAAAGLFWLFFSRGQLPSRDILTTGPWWMWLGGICGAVYICTAVFAVPRIGAAYYIAALVTGQLAASMFIDHFGLVGLIVKEMTPGKWIGLVLMIAGLISMKFA